MRLPLHEACVGIDSWPAAIGRKPVLSLSPTQLVPSLDGVSRRFDAFRFLFEAFRVSSGTPKDKGGLQK